MEAAKGASDASPTFVARAYPSGEGRKDRVEVIASVERRRRRIQHSMRPLDSLPLLRLLELRQAA
jgi:hypothetical protein